MTTNEDHKNKPPLILIIPQRIETIYDSIPEIYQKEFELLLLLCNFSDQSVLLRRQPTHSHKFLRNCLLNLLDSFYHIDQQHYDSPRSN